MSTTLLSSRILMLVVSALLALVLPAQTRGPDAHVQTTFAASVVDASPDASTALLHEGVVSLLNGSIESDGRGDGSRLRTALLRGAADTGRVRMRVSDESLLTYSFDLSAHPAHLIRTGLAPPLS